MKLPLNWLVSFVPADMPVRELAERLTMSGSLVERVTNTGAAFEQIIVARVSSLERHPNADTLWLATLDLGDRTQRVVTGAQNLFEGAIVPFIGIGSRLPGQEKPLEGRSLRGIRSEGMVCSGMELGLSDDHDGILILNEMAAFDAEARAFKPGMPLSEVLGEWVFDLEITPNRPDCLSIYGMAREVAAITGQTLSAWPDAKLDGPVLYDGLALEIQEPALCEQISAVVVGGVRVGPSPKWLVDRLSAAGMRSINNIVDVTNYVMLELGQPLHAYDLETLRGPSLRVRRAREGEKLTSLDGIERTLTAEMLLIADDERAIGIAGVMGGLDTEVSAGTRTVLLEAGTFNGRSVRRTGVALGLRSEASSRFEKGLPIALAARAARRAAVMIAEVAGGSVDTGVMSAGLHEPAPRQIVFAPKEVHRLLGTHWSTQHIVGNLAALGFSVDQVDDDSLIVTIPWWRGDIHEAADLVEEVARVTGFDAIPETLPRGGVEPRPTSDGHRWSGPARNLLLACGLDEASSPGLSSLRNLHQLMPRAAAEPWLASVVPNPDAAARAGSMCLPIRVVNPLTPDREILRPMLLPGLLDALRDNLRAGDEYVAFFELDVCALSVPGTLPFERRNIAIVMAGNQQAKRWTDASRPVDFFDLKGCIEILLDRFGLRGAVMQRAEHPLLHPGRAASVRSGMSNLGFLGELHPELAERWDISQRAYVAEFDFDAIAASASADRQFHEFSRQPSARRDLAIIVDETREAAEVLAEIRKASKGMLSRVDLFDVYQGAQLPAGKKSLACTLMFQDMDRTLTDDEVEKAIARIRKTLEHRLHATFRA